MKRYLLTLPCLLAFAAQAQMMPENNDPHNYSYAQDRVAQGYGVPVYQNGGGYGGANTQVRVAPASSQAYGFYQQPVESNYNANTPRSTMMWYPTQQQRALANGQVYVNPPYEMEEEVEVYQSPVYKSKVVQQKRGWYADLHLGVGGTSGWKGNLDTPVGPVWGIAVGTRLSPTLRVDAEFAYHTKAKLTKTAVAKAEYKQYDLGANVYYDFPVQSHIVVKPFVGLGLWGVNGKVTVSRGSKHISSKNHNFKLGVSAAAGVAYPINQVLSLIALGRVRYIAMDDALWNIEGLMGIRYHF